jgi:glycosyltransferase involved in cell wall biosynthesis
MRVLMVSTEYPPMLGGVGRYTSNLTQELRKLGIDVFVVCNENGYGELSGLSPTNTENSQILLKIVSEIRPNVVHIQFELGMYGLIIDPRNPRNSGTYIDSFYATCRDIPIVTTFHSGYTLSQWISIASLIKKSGRIGRAGIPLRLLIRFWKYFLNYQAFKNLNKEKLWMSYAGITFSYYMSHLLGGGEVIYHGAEPSVFPRPSKKEAKSFFSLPLEKRIALVIGFGTVTKGWEVLNQMDIQDKWIVVANSSRSYYNTENYDSKWIEGNTGKDKVIDLQKGFLSDKELSMLFFAADAVLLPYKVTAASGVMFDALAHGLPFVATDLKFFKEFASQKLGITVKRRPREFSNGVKKLDKNYSNYTSAVDAFKDKLKWNYVARQHESIYSSAIERKKRKARL